MQDLKKEYQILKEDYNLPSFEELDAEFEIRVIELEKSGHLIKAVLRVIINKLNYIISQIESVANNQPQHVHLMIELRNLTDEQKKKLYSFYKKISSLLHEVLAAELKSDKEIAEQIKKTWKLWPGLKKESLEHLTAISEAWAKKEEEQKTRNEFTG